MSLNVANCPRCGRVYARGFREVCQNCYQDIEKEYEKCHKYLKENKGTTLQELSDETEVSVKQITKFIKEGRISLMNFPNLGYPCESCGVPIKDGHLCPSCKNKLQRQINNALEEKPRTASNSQGLHNSYNIKETRRDR